jgi:hypothetical protein
MDSCLLDYHKYHISVTTKAYKFNVLNSMRWIFSLIKLHKHMQTILILKQETMLCMHTQVHTHTHAHTHIHAQMFPSFISLYTIIKGCHVIFIAWRITLISMAVKVLNAWSHQFSQLLPCLPFFFFNMVHLPSYFLYFHTNPFTTLTTFLLLVI